MNYFNPVPRQIVMKDSDKGRLLKRVIEKEKRGWECIKPITKENKEVALDGQKIEKKSLYKREYYTTFDWVVTMRIAENT